MSLIVDEILGLYESRGGADYTGDGLSHTDHALQTAALAVQAGASDTLVAAALLHDVGHLLAAVDEGASDSPDVDDRHEARGAAFIGRHFQVEVARAIGLHVAAKRYLCAVEPGYAERLAPDSVHSLALQGGPLAGREIQAFERKTAFREAVMLRRVGRSREGPGSPGARSRALPPAHGALSPGGPCPARPRPRRGDGSRRRSASP